MALIATQLPMKIRMNTTAAGPDGVYQFGQVYVVPGSVAKSLVDSRAAEPYTEPVKKPKLANKDEE